MSRRPPTAPAPTGWERALKSLGWRPEPDDPVVVHRHYTAEGRYSPAGEYVETWEAVFNNDGTATGRDPENRVTLRTEGQGYVTVARVDVWPRLPANH